MSAYAIVSRETAPEVARVLEERGMADAPLVVAESGEGPPLLAEAARVPADVLILDVATGPGLGKAVLRYRLARPDTRVILLALGRRPGGPETAQVVQAGVYDVVTALEDLAAAIDGPPADFSRAALWLDPSLGPEAEQRPREVVEKRVPISTRPVLVAVVAAAPGAGATTVAALLAGYLARQGYRTCLVAGDGTRDLELVSGREPGREPARWLPGLDLCAGDFRDALVTGRYEYVVADLGHPRWESAAALAADLVAVVLPPPHRIDRVLEWRESAAYRGQPVPRARYVVIGRVRDPEGLGRLWGTVFNPTSRREEPEPVEIVPLPLPDQGDRWPPGYRRPTPELDEACRAALAGVLPDGPRPRPRRRPRVKDDWLVWAGLAALLALTAYIFASPETRALLFEPLREAAKDARDLWETATAPFRFLFSLF